MRRLQRKTPTRGVSKAGVFLASRLVLYPLPAAQKPILQRQGFSAPSRKLRTSTARSVRSSSQSISSREGPALRVASELADPVGPLEVGEHQDVEIAFVPPK